MATIDELIAEYGCTYATVATSDTNGLLRGQFVSARGLRGIAEGGMGMSPVTMALDPQDVIQPLPGVSDAGADFHDGKLELDLNTARAIPWHGEGKRLLVLADFAGVEAAWCPRRIFRSVLARAHAVGLAPKYGFELEYTLFDETPESARAKGYRDLKTATMHASHDLVIYQTAQSDWYDDLVDMCASLNVDLYKAHEEIGGGFMEVCIAAGRDVEPADQAIVLRNFMKVLALKKGKLVTYMPRWSDQADSQSTHVHMSLLDHASGRPLFHDAAGGHGMSEMFGHFIGGLQRHLGDCMLVMAPSVNAYRRFAPGTFAPPALTWGYENRTSGLRVVGETAGSLRVENRLPGSDSNPYLTAAIMLAAGLDGIANRTPPQAELKGNGYEQETDPALQFPRDMPAAIARFKASAFAKEWLGARFVEGFASTRQGQFDEFARKVPDVELARFLELS